MDILIGLYTTGTPHKDFIPAFFEFVKENNLKHRLELCYMNKLPVHLAQNIIAKKSLGYDYLMFIEDDTTSFPVGLLDALIVTHKPIISPKAYSRHYNHDLMSFIKVKKCVLDTDENLFGCIESVNGEGVVKVDMTHFMCMLIQPNVFSQLNYPFFQYGLNGTGTDSYFAENCLRNRVGQYVHMDYVVGHCGLTSGGTHKVDNPVLSSK